MTCRAENLAGDTQEPVVSEGGREEGRRKGERNKERQYIIWYQNDDEIELGTE